MICVNIAKNHLIVHSHKTSTNGILGGKNKSIPTSVYFIT